jgi:hypothetical protein
MLSDQEIIEKQIQFYKELLAEYTQKRLESDEYIVKVNKILSEKDTK